MQLNPKKESAADVEYLVISSLSCSEKKGSIPFFGLCFLLISLFIYFKNKIKTLLYY